LQKKNKEAGFPKYLWNRKNPIAYREYYNQKVQEANRKKKGLKNIDEIEEDDIMEKANIPTSNVPATIPKQEAPQGYDDLFKVFDDLVDDPNDPVIKNIKKYGKYIPLAMKFIQGFTERMQEFNKDKQQQKPPIENQKVQPPEGWLYMSPLQRMSSKYDAYGNTTSWYRQGEAFEQSMTVGQVYQQVSSGRPVEMEQTIHGRRQAAMQRSEDNTLTMQELERRANNEKWDSTKPQEQPKKEEIIDEKKIDTKEILEKVSESMIDEQKKYLEIIIGYFKTREISKFEQDLKNIDKTVDAFVKKWGWAFPNSVRDMFKRTTIGELKQALTEADPAKMTLIKKKKLEKKLTQMWEEMQKKL
jgi:hypothetical protein